MVVLKQGKRSAHVARKRIFLLKVTKNVRTDIKSGP